MSKLYVSEYENGKYGIFDSIDDCIYQENFKPLIFDSIDEAKMKLSAYENEKERENKTRPFTIDEAKKYAESHFWKYASTYAETAPHEYMVKHWLVDDDKLLFERFVATMKANSVIGYFYGHENNYFILGDHYYWYMPTADNLPVDLINRTTTDYLEFRDGAYYYRGKYNIIT